METVLLLFFKDNLKANFKATKQNLRNSYLDAF